MLEKEEGILAVTESFRRKGAFWRLLSLVQIPVSLFLTVYFVTRYLGADTIVHVNEIKGAEDLGGRQIPDKEYVNIAQNIVNLIGTYQPINAREQFETAREYMLESAEKSFDDSQLTQELLTAEESDISQELFVNDYAVSRKANGAAKVCIFGERHKIVERQPLPGQEVTYCFVIQPDEPFEGNPFGLLVSEFSQKLGPQPQAALPRKISPKFDKPKPTKKKRELRSRRNKTESTAK